MGDTARVWAFSEEERIADIAFAKEAGSLDCFLRSGIRYICDRGSLLFDLTSWKSSRSSSSESGSSSMAISSVFVSV